MDNFIVSARKYRPSTFVQVVGQDSIISTLKNAILTGHLAQAFLFTGPRGVGKTTCARIMAKTINCLNPTSDGEPCNECESCRAFNENASFNIHELDAASNNSVEDIRKLVEQVRIPPQAGKYKVYIIDEVHMLSTAAFNAFLKTLEEPPAYAKFILATTEKHKIIPTILSRCQIFDFKRIGVSDIAGHLNYVAKSEHIVAEEEALHVIAQKADGALRDALSTFDQIASFSGEQITYKDVIENLNILDFEYYFRVTDALVSGDLSTVLLIFNEILQNGFDGQDFLTGLNEHFRNLLVVKNPKTVSLFESGQSLRERYQDQAQRCSRAFLFKALELVNQYDLNYKNSNNKRLHVEIAMTQLSIINAESLVSEEVVVIEKVKEKRPVYQQSEKPKQDVVEEIKQKQEEAKKPVVEEEKTEPVHSENVPVIENPENLIEEVPEDNPLPDQNIETLVAPEVEKKEFVPKVIHRKIERKPATLSGTGRSIRNISIKGGLRSIKEMQEKANQEEPVIITEFTQEKLEECWKQFVENYREQSPSFVNTLVQSNPTLGPDYVIEYKVPNILITKDQLNNSILLNFLKTELNNNQITLSPSVMERDEVKQAFTEKERFDEMMEKYSVMRDLKDALDLELE
ncbi:MAG: DNA polymerase III subunit gamma/tau [Bacteroidales bacterium]|nr:DNA polymerase III subunit gamma/tau [Bacteroidales bacterium]